MPVNIHGKEYFTVAERMQWLDKEIGRDNYSLNTDVISFENGIVIMKATLTISEKESVQSFTGHAYEKEGSSQINKTSALENCETSAIGRALAAAGYAGTEYASADEVANAISQQKTKRPVSVKDQAEAKKNGFMTKTQEDKLREMIQSHHVSDEERTTTEGWLADPHGHSKKSASDAIEKLSGMIQRRSEEG